MVAEESPYEPIVYPDFDLTANVNDAVQFLRLRKYHGVEQSIGDFNRMEYNDGKTSLICDKCTGLVRSQEFLTSC